MLRLIISLTNGRKYPKSIYSPKRNRKFVIHLQNGVFDISINQNQKYPPEIQHNHKTISVRRIFTTEKQEADRTRKKIHYCVISVFNAIHCDRIVSIIQVLVPGPGAVTRAKPGTEPGVHKLQLLSNYQIRGSIKFRPTIGWNGRMGLPTSRSLMTSHEN